ncbi:MAG: hypothetical protein NTV31_10455 [Bacteroidia bacterium]|nr:hypothetical protein [Bacteroidia bacterium]
MKTKCSFLMICSLTLMLISSCQKELPRSETIPGGPKLKRVLLFASKDSNEPISVVEEYEYDEVGRISKTSSPMYQDGVTVGTIKYDEYYYNSYNQLIKKMNFNANINSPSGFINLKNYTFTYNKDGSKKKESIEYPQAGLNEYYLYEYDNDKLVKIKKYNTKSEFESYIENQYDKSEKLIIESSYTPDGQCFSYTIHTYSGPLLIKSVVYQKNGILLREINRSYDESNNLIILESNELAPFSSSMSYVLKYEYYEEI